MLVHDPVQKLHEKNEPISISVSKELAKKGRIKEKWIVLKKKCAQESYNMNDSPDGVSSDSMVDFIDE